MHSVLIPGSKNSAKLRYSAIPPDLYGLHFRDRYFDAQHSQCLEQVPRQSAPLKIGREPKAWQVIDVGTRCTDER